MKKIFIKHNPYNFKTEILTDEEILRESTLLKTKKNKDFKLYAKKLLSFLIENYSDDEFEIIFNGLLMDYEDLIFIANETGKWRGNIKYNHLEAKEIDEKEQEIEEIFRYIEDISAQELKLEELKKGFEEFNNRDFVIDVMATMSAGKSTLINAILHKNILPSRQEACTSTITKVIYRNKKNFSAKTYNKINKKINYYSNINENTIYDLNNKEDIFTIEIKGNIPFVKKQYLNPIFVDTPGPNNSRDIRHKKIAYNRIESHRSNLILYMINATQIGSNDDDDFLGYVSDSTKKLGEEIKNKILFLVNKLDEFNTKNGDDVISSLRKVEKYLEEKGIEEPKVFPISAKMSLNIRLLKDKNNKLTQDTIDETEFKVKRINRNTDLHLEKYHGLLSGVYSKDFNLLKTKDIYEEALLHTGIIPLEEELKRYIKKYGRIDKIRKISTLLKENFNSKKVEEYLYKENIDLKNNIKNIDINIDYLEEKLIRGYELNKLMKEIKKIDLQKNITKYYEKVKKDFNNDMNIYINNIINSRINKKISLNEGREISLALKKTIMRYKSTIKEGLRKVIENDIMKENIEVLEKYNSKIIGLPKNKEFEYILLNFDKEGLFQGFIKNINISKIVLESIYFLNEEEHQYLKNKNERWYKLWSFFKKKEDRVNLKKSRYVDIEKMKESMILLVNNNIEYNIQSSINYFKKKSDMVKFSFNEIINNEKKYMLKIIKEHYLLLQKHLDTKEDRNNKEKKLRINQINIGKINYIYNKINSILEI